MTISDKMLNTINKYGMIKNGDKVLVALSGGADSVSLMLGLLELREKLNIKITAAHVNHLLRGEDSQNDMNFVEELCQKNKIKLYLLKKDINEYKKNKGCSLEDAGRQVRYSFFKEISEKENCIIATAHTLDDNCETFFISALRGTRITGIPPKRGNIIRPLIETSKEEIYDYLKEKNQEFCVDKTNFTDDYFRNKIRLNLIPYVNKEFKTNIAELLSNNLDVITCENEYLVLEAKEYIKENCVICDNKIILNIDSFLNVHIAKKRRILREIYYMLSDKGYISYQHIDSIIKLISLKNSGKRLNLCSNIEAEISFNNLIIKKSEEIKMLKYNTVLEVENKFGSYSFFLSDNKKSDFYFYTDDASFVVRSWENGDKINLSNGHHKKLSDFFGDKKIPKDERNKMPVIVDGEGICAVWNKYLRKEKKKNKIYIHIKGEQ